MKLDVAVVLEEQFDILGKKKLTASLPTTIKLLNNLSIFHVCIYTICEVLKQF